MHPRDRRGDRRRREPIPRSVPSCSPAPATGPSAPAWTCGRSPPASRRAFGDDEATRGFFRLIEGETTVPVVGAANGTAVAGGFELLLGVRRDRRLVRGGVRLARGEARAVPRRWRHVSRHARRARHRVGDGPDRRRDRRRARLRPRVGERGRETGRGDGDRPGARGADRRQRAARGGGGEGARPAGRLRRRRVRGSVWTSGNTWCSAARTPRRAPWRSSRSGAPVWQGR